jgi:hypothetical protein
MVTSCLVSISVIANTMILNMNHRMSSTHEMSQFVRWLFLGILSRLLYMRLPTKTGSIIDERIISSKPYKSGKMEDNKSSYRSSYSNISMYDNIHVDPGGLEPQGGLNEYVGLGVNHICWVCHNKRMAGLSSSAKKGFEGLCFIAKHYSVDDLSNRVGYLILNLPLWYVYVLNLCYKWLTLSFRIAL